MLDAWHFPGTNFDIPRPATLRMLKILQVRPAPLNRLKEPFTCEECASYATLEVLVDLDAITRVHRVCEECAKKAEF